jgi:hypothetical protein
MAKPPAHSTYARYVGEIAISWNKIEREVNNLIYYFMGGEADVAGFILGSMGNQTKADFLSFLVQRSKRSQQVKDGVIYAVQLFNRIRENRNIVEHGVPLRDPSGSYGGQLVKLDKSSNFRTFSAPIELVKEVAEAARRTEGWLRAVMTALTIDEDPENHEPSPHGKSLAEASQIWLSSLGRPPLPRKIGPLELEEAPKGGRRQPSP